MPQGLLCSVYRNPLGDCTNGGVTSKHAQVVLLGAEGPFEPTADAPALHVGAWKGQLIALPVKPMRYASGECFSLDGWMFGGNFIYSSDSRFPSGQPIKVFDRREW